MIFSACLASVAASAGEGDDGGAGAASSPPAEPSAGAATQPGSDAKGEGAAASVVPPSEGHDSDATAGEKSVGGDNGAVPPMPPPKPVAHPARPSTRVAQGRIPTASPLAAPLHWLARNVSRSLARAAGAANRTGAAALGAPLAWLGARLHGAPADQDSAREAVNKGQIVPLASILKTIQKSVPGDVLKVALVRDVEGSWSYSVTVLTPQGYYRDVDVDAGANRITQIKGH